jgi:hypothetical protein
VVTHRQELLRQSGGRVLRRRGHAHFIAKIKNGLTPDVKKQVFERLRPLETKVCSFDKLPEQQLYSIWTRESHVCDEKRYRENGAP